MFHKVRRLFKRRYKYRSSISGEYVSRLFALTHPTTTVKEAVDAD